MATITEHDINKLAALANLEITDDERKQLTPQIASIVLYIEQLNELDTSGVESVTGGFTPEGARTAVAREDIRRESLGQSTALDQAPDPYQGYFRVPKVI